MLYRWGLSLRHQQTGERRECYTYAACGMDAADAIFKRLGDRAWVIDAITKDEAFFPWSANIGRNTVG